MAPILGSYITASVAENGQTIHLPELRPSLEMQEAIFRVLSSGPSAEVCDKPIEMLANDLGFQRALHAVEDPTERRQWKDLSESRRTVMEFVAGVYGRYVMDKSRRYWPHVSLEAKIDGGMYGLLFAIEHFDTARGTRFSSFLSHHVLKGIQEGICLAEGITMARLREINDGMYLARLFEEEFARRPSREELELQLFVNARWRHGGPYVSKPSIPEVMNYLGLCVSGVVHLQERRMSEALQSNAKQLSFMRAPVRPVSIGAKESSIMQNPRDARMRTVLGDRLRQEVDKLSGDELGSSDQPKTELIRGLLSEFGYGSELKVAISESLGVSVKQVESVAAKMRSAGLLPPIRDRADYATEETRRVLARMEVSPRTSPVRSAGSLRHGRASHEG